MHARQFAIGICALALAACSTTPTPPVSAEAVEDFIVANQLEEVKSLRSGRSDSWKVVNRRYVLYEGSRETFLLEFQRLCHDIDDNLVVRPDRRRDSNHIYARFDTFRGCLIGKIYPVTEVQALEITTLGLAPGPNNF